MAPKIKNAFCSLFIKVSQIPPFKLFHFAGSTFWCILVPWIIFLTAIRLLVPYVNFLVLRDFRFLPYKNRPFSIYIILQYAKRSALNNWIQTNWNFWKILKIDRVIAKWPLYFWPLKIVICPYLVIFEYFLFILIVWILF